MATNGKPGIADWLSEHWLLSLGTVGLGAFLILRKPKGAGADSAAKAQALAADVADLPPVAAVDQPGTAQRIAENASADAAFAAAANAPATPSQTTVLEEGAARAGVTTDQVEAAAQKLGGTSAQFLAAQLVENPGVDPVLVAAAMSASLIDSASAF
jgi:hypothetical protein